MEIASIELYKIGSLFCYACDTELSLSQLRKVTLANGDFVFVCGKCCDKLSKVCSVTIEEIDKPDITECAKCSIRYKCFTTREEQK